MRAVAVFPGAREVRLIERPEPRIESATAVKLRMLEVGVCGTDRDLCDFRIGAPPPGEDHFVLGHESLAEVMEAGPGAPGWARGDLAVLVVRLPCGPPACAACAAGRQDFCLSGDYREHGIKQLHGFMSEFVVVEARYLCRVPPALRPVAILTEPLTIAEKALAQFRAIETRLPYRRERRTAVVLGAGPVGLLGALLLGEEGFDTWVYSREPDSPVAGAVGARYVSSSGTAPAQLSARTGPIDFVYEAMGAPQAAYDVLQHLGPGGLFVFTGLPHGPVAVDWQRLGPSLLVGNQIVAGTINAGLEHYAAAVRHLAAFERRWPGAAGRIIGGRYPLEGYREAISGGAGSKRVVTPTPS